MCIYSGLKGLKIDSGWDLPQTALKD